MKRREIKDLATKTGDELQKLLGETRKRLFDLQMEFKMGKVKNTRQLFWTKKEIAYILTQLQRKEQRNG